MQKSHDKTDYYSNTPPLGQLIDAIGWIIGTSIRYGLITTVIVSTTVGVLRLLGIIT